MTDKHTLCAGGCAAEGLEQRARDVEAEVRRLKRQVNLLRQREKLNIHTLVKEVIDENEGER